MKVLENPEVEMQIPTNVCGLITLHLQKLSNRCLLAWFRVELILIRFAYERNKHFIR
jgi:hypothetical protein